MNKYYVYFDDGNFEIVEASVLETDLVSVLMYNEEGKIRAIFPLRSIKGIFPHTEDA